MLGLFPEPQSIAKTGGVDWKRTGNISRELALLGFRASSTFPLTLEKTGKLAGPGHQPPEGTTSCSF